VPGQAVPGEELAPKEAEVDPWGMLLVGPWEVLLVEAWAAVVVAPV